MMIRVYSGEQKGATAFFRNRPLMRTLCQLLAGQTPRVLMHSVSIGAEAYSFAVYCQMMGIECECIHATDINQDFLGVASKGVYPLSVLEHMSPDEQKWFERSGEFMSPLPAIRKAVDFLLPCSFVDAKFREPYDVVFVMNALTYVTAENQAKAIAQIAGYNSQYLLLTAFHPATIKRDLMDNGYEPVEDNREEIHNAWGDRLVSNAPPDHSWMLPAYSEIDEYEYKYCAIFRKK